jgi:hypothetical protein
MIMDFSRGDKIYKIINGDVDKSKIYEIDTIKIENGGSWSDGYFTNWVAFLVGEDEPLVIRFTVWGEKSEIYAEKAE